MAASSSAPDNHTAQVLMTLAGIAYGQPSAIPGYLAEDPLTGGEWTPVWVAAEVDVPLNFAYIARSRTSGAYVIAIRGTYPNPFSPAYWDDASQDNPLGDLQPWPGGAPADAAVSGGTWQAYQNLIALTDDSNVTLTKAAAAIPAGATVYVTGHSLGGTLAPVIGLWLNSLPAAVVPTICPFAGMTPGNAAFAALAFADGTPLASRVWRYNNTLDTVPYGWDRVLETRNFYQPAPRGGLVIEAALGLMAFRLLGYGYTAIGTEIPLQGTVRPSAIDCELVGYVLENLYQHLPDTYLALLGAPPLPFTLGFGSFVVPNNHVTAKHLRANRLPVYFG